MKNHNQAFWHEDWTILPSQLGDFTDNQGNFRGMKAMNKLCCVFAIFFSLVASASELVRFTNSCTVSFPFTTEVNGLAVADFNGDSHLDVFTAAGGGGIAYGDGQGLFAMTNTPTVIPVSTCVAAGDVNGDGKADLVAGWPGVIDWVYILTGNGNGTFNFSEDNEASRFHIGSNTNVAGVALSDLDSDGKLDLTAVSSNLVFIFAGVGDGTFVFARNFAAGGSTRCVSSVDVNSDGLPDLLIGLQSDEGIWLNNGDGTFAAPIYFDVSNDVDAATAADYDGDGVPELLITGGGHGFPRIYHGQGNGQFLLNTSYYDVIATGATQVGVGDWNMDGKADFVSAGQNVGLRVMLNQTRTPLYISAGENVVISWDAWLFDGYQLEYSSDLEGTNWTAITTNIFQIGTTNVYTNILSDAVGFFRLTK